MPTLSETMTLAVFSARVTAGTLNIGQIYTISDKGWVLQAHTNTVAKPLHGALRMNNGDILPNGIEPDELIIKIEPNSSGEDITVSPPLNYRLIGGYYIDPVGIDDPVSLFAQNIFNNEEINIGSMAIDISPTKSSINFVIFSGNNSFPKMSISSDIRLSGPGLLSPLITYLHFKKNI